MAINSKTITEKEIETQILDYLNNTGFFAWKNPCIGRYDTKRKAFIKPKGKYQITGVSDIIAIGKIGSIAYTFFIEVKKPKGRQTDNQKWFQKEVNRHGGIYFIARSVEDIQQYFSSISN